MLLAYSISGEAIADHLKSSFAIIRFNSRTYESGGVMAVVKAYAAAEHLLRDYEFGQSDKIGTTAGATSWKKPIWFRG